MPHDEFINYVFRGGIVAGASLLMFFVLLFYESKKLKTEDKICMRVLLIAILAGCTFDYFMTTQMLVALFATLLSIFLSKQITCEEDVVE
jgi:O-antigen ligase